MKIRAHRGSLDASMQTQAEVEPTMDAVIDYIAGPAIGVSGGCVSVNRYGFDERIGWDTYLVIIDGHAVAFTDGPVERV